jgi:transcriptional regulator with XRE-family HTH domain
MQWSLTQPELAFLLDMTDSALCKIETLAMGPTRTVIVGAEVIFGIPARKAFPALYAQAERNILRRAADLSEQLEGRTDEDAKRKRELLTDMIRRAEVDNAHL